MNDEEPPTCDMSGCQEEPHARVANDPTGVELVCEKHATFAFHQGYDVYSL